MSPEQAAQIAAHFAKVECWWVVNLDINNKPCKVCEFENLSAALGSLTGRAVVVAGRSLIS